MNRQHAVLVGLLGITILFFQNCGVQSSNSSPTQSAPEISSTSNASLAPPSCSDSPIKGVWIADPTTELVEEISFDSDCNGYSKMCGTHFTFENSTANSGSATIKVLDGQELGPNCLPTGDHSCTYSVTSTPTGRALSYSCGNLLLKLRERSLGRTAFMAGGIKSERVKRDNTTVIEISPSIKYFGGGMKSFSLSGKCVVKGIQAGAIENVINGMPVGSTVITQTYNYTIGQLNESVPIMSRLLASFAPNINFVKCTTYLEAPGATKATYSDPIVYQTAYIYL